MTSKLNGSKAKPKKTRRELESSLSRFEDSVQLRFEQLEKVLSQVIGAHQTIWNNQQELSRSAELLDEQFAVSTRMMIVAVNHILDRLGAADPNQADDHITAADIEKLFKDWAQFRKRPDFKNLMMEWFLGMALDKMPPVPEPEIEEVKKDEEPDGQPIVSEERPQDSSFG